jgi:type IV pilus assembly protein PilO
MIAPKKDLARILSELNELATSNSLVVGPVTYKPVEIKDEKLLAYTLGLTVTGRYGAVKSFIGDLGRFKEMVTITTISLNNPKLTEEKVDLRLDLTVYLRMEGK